MLNRVIIMGRLTRDPEIRNTQSGTTMCRFSVAVDRPFKNKHTNEREADFLECSAFGKTAEFVGRYFSKGKMILAEGEIRNNNYTDKDGVKHYKCEIFVNNVSFCGDSSGNQNQGYGGNQNQHYDPQYGNSIPPKNQGGMNLDEYETIVNGGETPF